MILCTNINLRVRMRLRYEKVLKSENAMVDGYTKVDGYFGPFRMNKCVVYYSPFTGGYIAAKLVYKIEGKN